MKSLFILLLSISCCHFEILKFNRRDDKTTKHPKVKYDDYSDDSDCADPVPKDLYSDDIIINTVKVPLDHFNSNNKSVTKWIMTYYQNDAFFISSSPIYILVGGNEPVSPEYLSKGLMYELAKETNGSMFANEHRYYGKKGLIDDEIDDEAFEDLTYLHSTQVLEDLIFFINHLKQEFGYEDSNVVLVGAGYAGNLAAWMRIKNPDVVTAALASSAPLQATTEFEDFLNRAVASYASSVSLNCMDNIQYVFEFFIKTIKEGDFDQLAEKGKICKNVNMTVPENQYTLFFVEMFMFLSNVEDGPKGMNESCKQFQEHHKKIIDSQNRVPRETRYHRLTYDTCNDYDFQHFVEKIQSPAEVQNKLWLYQSCNEFGYFPVTSGDVEANATTYTNFVYGPDVLPSQFYFKLCSAVFGEEYTEEVIKKKIDETNVRYGGRTPKNASNIVFTHGSLDPWGALGYEDSNNTQIRNIVIDFVAHAQDLRPSNVADPKGLTDVRENIKLYIKEILENSTIIDSEEARNSTEKLDSEEATNSTEKPEVCNRFKMTRVSN